MKDRLFLLLLWMSSVAGNAQNFELVDREESLQTGFNQLVRIPIKIKNTSDHAQFYIIKKTRGDLGESQKGYFCLENKCLEPTITEFSKKVEAGETVNLNFTIESGMQQALNNFKFEIFPKGIQAESQEYNVSLAVDERLQRSIYQSKEISVNDVYPNPAQDQAIIEYKIYNDQLKAKIVVHNVLGRSMNEYELSPSDSRIKILVDDFAPGVYFYTLYVNNSGVLTRKIMVRK
jgi:hypothetical protein